MIKDKTEYGNINRAVDLYRLTAFLLANMRMVYNHQKNII